MINHQQDLLKAVEKIQQHQIIAVDTEFYWRNTYYPELCLIQIALSETEVILIDTLNPEIDLTILNPIFANPNIEKIMHASDNDIKVIRHALGADFESVFDTQIASALLGYNHQTSLQNLLAEFEIAEIEKEETLSDWRERPLSNEQVIYAENDVIYLYCLRQKLHQALTENQKLEIFNEEMRYRVEDAFFTDKKVAHLKFKSLKHLKPHTQVHLKALALWRESLAQERNRSVRHIIDDKALIEIAKLHPNALEQLHSILTAKQVARYGQQILEVLAKVTHDTNTKRAAASFLNKEDVAHIYDRFKNICLELNIASEQVASKEDIKQFMINIIKPNTIPNNKLIHGWRYQYVGKKLQQIYDGL